MLLLLASLEKKNHQISIMISMNGSSIVMFGEKSIGNINMVSNHRIFADYFTLSLDETKTIPLADHFSLVDCLSVVGADHRKLYRLDADSKLFVYLAVDDASMLVNELGSAQMELSGDAQDRYRL